MPGFDLDLTAIQQMLLPEAASDAASPHGDVAVHLRGVRLGWVIDLVNAVQREIDATWARYDAASRAYEHLNWSGSIPEPERPVIPRDQPVTALFLVDHVVRPLTAGGRTTFHSRIPAAYVAKPTLFVSHCWSNVLGGAPGSTLGALLDSAHTEASPDAPIWLDALVYNQHHPQTIASDMEAIIGSVGAITAYFDPDTVLRRLWCLWELLCANKSGAGIHAVEIAADSHYFGRAREHFERSFTSVIDAETTLAADRAQILAALEQTFGSLPAADAFVRRTVLEPLTRRSDAPWNQKRVSGDHLEP